MPRVLGKRERVGRFYAMYGSQKSPSIAFLLLAEQCFSDLSLVPFTCAQQRQLFANLDSRSRTNPSSWANVIQSRLSVSIRQTVSSVPDD